MQKLTDEDYDLDKYREDHMNAYNLRFPPVSSAVKRVVENLRKENEAEKQQHIENIKSVPSLE